MSQKYINKKSAITAIGTAVPEYVLQQMDIAEFISTAVSLNVGEKRLLKSVYKSTGIEQRYTVLSDYTKMIGDLNFFPNKPDQPFPTTAMRMKIYQDNALSLALSAVNACLAQLDNFNREQITHVITVSCTGMYAPGIDIELIQALNLKSTTQRTTINFMGCYGAFNAIKVGDAICRADNEATVLIVCIELCSIHFQKNMNLDNMISNSIFADGAAAILLQSSNEQTKKFGIEILHNDLVAQTKQEMTWHIGDYGFDIALSSYVPDLIQSGMANFVKSTKNLLSKHELSFSDFDFYAIHPGGIKILQACEKSLSINTQDNRYSYQVLRNYGNMSSATILFVLKAIWDDINYIDHQKYIFACAFGPGLTLESMVLKTHCLQ